RNAGVQNRVDILPAFHPFASRNVGMREFVYHRHRGLAPDHSIGVHLFEFCPAIGQHPPRNTFEAFRFSDGLLSAMRFEIGDYNVRSLVPEFLSLLQHSVRLANTGGITQVNLELSFRRLAHCPSSCGKIRTSTPSEPSIRRSSGLRRNQERPARLVCPKNN